mgnify:CR=1 FL=1
MFRRLLSLIAGLAATCAGAADLGVMPVRVELSARQDRQAITVSNRGAEPVLIQAETVSWVQTDGEDQYTPTRELLVNPPLFTIPSGGSQIVRVGLRRPVDAERELSYRIFLREVPGAPPSATGDKGQQIRVLLELRLPVYVAPARPQPAQRWRASRSADGGIELELANTGNAHVVVGGLRLLAPGALPGAAPLAEMKGGGSVLAGQRRVWHLAPPAPDGRFFVLEVRGENGSQHVALDLEGS